MATCYFLNLVTKNFAIILLFNNLINVHLSFVTADKSIVLYENAISIQISNKGVKINIRCCFLDTGFLEFITPYN